MKLITGSSHTTLAQKIAEKCGAELVHTSLSSFHNGERRVRIEDSVKGEDAILLQSISAPVDSNLIELLLLSDALERSGAKSIRAIIPWMGYSLQDKVFLPGEPIAAKVIANLISQSYIDFVTLLDLHNSSIPGFFSIPTEHLSADQLFANYIKDEFSTDSVIVSPDFGGLKRARIFAEQLGYPLINIDKSRDLKTGKVTVNHISGEDVKDKTAIVYDDCIMSGSTLIAEADILKEQGAKNIIFVATHGVFTPGSIEKLEKSQADQIIITNSIEHENLPSKFVELDISSILS